MRMALRDGRRWNVAIDEAARAGAREPGDDFPRAMGRPARQALAAAGYTRLAELESVDDGELLALHGFGPKGLRILRQALAARNAAQDPNPGLARSVHERQRGT